MSNTAFVAVIDDDRRVRESLESLLDSARIHAQLFASAESFLTDATLSSCQCLIIDVRMPGMSGFQLQRRLLEQEINIPIILISATQAGDEAHWAMKHGAIAFLQKPFEGEELLSWVIKALGH